METEVFEGLGLHRKLKNSVVVNGHSSMDILDQLSAPGDAAYNPSPEAYPDDTVPRGSIHRFAAWAGSTVFPGTARDISVYVPHQFNVAGGEANLLICNDGEWYLDPGGAVRATRVFDSLLSRRAIPPTVAIFIQPGTVVSTDAAILASMDYPPSDQRSYEYDRLTDDYPRMLVDEVLPFIADGLGLRPKADPAAVAICGVSSGGIAAFNAAWQMPDRFGCVISHCGSFTNIHGGHNFPYLVRQTDRKPIRVWMQSGENDARAPWGNWPLANKLMAESLAYAGYDVVFEFGTGAHNLRHGGALFADALRWLWGKPRSS